MIQNKIHTLVNNFCYRPNFSESAQVGNILVILTKGLRLAICISIVLIGSLLTSCGQASNVLEVCASTPQLDHSHRERLEKFARQMKLAYADAFVNTTININKTGELPHCYLSKTRARKKGWQPGTSLWESAPGHSIGGSRFGNYEGRLPKKYEGRYVEADLDFDGNRRGANRLVFVKGQPGKWLMWVTVDHYDSFKKVPRE